MSNKEKTSELLCPNYRLVRTSVSTVMSSLMVANIVSMNVGEVGIKMSENRDRTYDVSSSVGYETDHSGENEIISSLAIEAAEKSALNLRAFVAERLAQEAIFMAEEAARFAEEKRQATFDSYIEEYCLYFNLDSAKVIEIARTLTENYTTGFDEIIGSEIFKPKNDEAACLIFVRRLMKNQLTVKLSEFGLEKSDLVIDDAVYGNDREEGEELVLRNGMTGTQFLGRICDLLDMDKYYALSISYLEAGKNFGSKICRTKNNFGGMRADGEFFTYPSPEAGIIVFCMNLKNYEKYGFTNIYELSGFYVHHDINNPSESWVKNVLGYHYTFTENADEYFLPEPEIEEEVDPESADHAMVMTPVN